MTQVQDWSAYEVADEPELHPAEDAEKVVTIPQAEREQYLALYQQKVSALVPTDDRTVKSCGEFVEQCKLAAKRVEDKRTALTEPLSKQVKDINAIYMPVRDAFSGMAKAVTVRVNKFMEDRKRAAELEQQEILAEAARKQAELDRKAREAKAKAAQALESGDEVAATVLESKAAILEQKASEVVPMQVAAPNGKVDLGTSTVSFGGAKKVWALPGWDKEEKLYADSAILYGVDLNWLIRFCVVDTVRLNAAFKSGEVFPKPFIVTNDYSKSRVRT